MDFVKLPKKEIRSFDARKLADTAASLRKELVTMRMDVYNAGPQVKAKARNMRKTLARLLTIAGETKQPVVKAAAKTKKK